MCQIFLLRLLFKLAQKTLRIPKKTVLSDWARFKNQCSKWKIDFNFQINAKIYFPAYIGFFSTGESIVSGFSGQTNFLEGGTPGFFKKSDFFYEKSWWVRKIFLAFETTANRFPGRKNPSIYAWNKFSLWFEKVRADFKNFSFSAGFFSMKCCCNMEVA